MSANTMPSVAGQTTETVLREALARVEDDHDLAALVTLKLTVAALVARFDARAARKAAKADPEA